MRRITLREFQRNASRYLYDLPLALTRYRRVVCEVHEVDKSTKKQAIAETEDLKKSEKTVQKDLSKLQKEQNIETCKHGSLFDLCKHGCVK